MRMITATMAAMLLVVPSSIRQAGARQPTVSQSIEAPLIEGEVRKVDKETGKITSSTGRYRTLKCPP